MPVAGGNHHDAFVEQAFEQTAQDHCIGNVLNLEFVKADQPGFLGDFGGDFGQRILELAVALAPAMHGVVNFEHEFMKMDAALVVTANGLIKHIHQHRFAAPDRPIEIQPLGRRFGGAPREPEPFAPTRTAARRLIHAERMPQYCSFSTASAWTGS